MEYTKKQAIVMFLLAAASAGVDAGDANAIAAEMELSQYTAQELDQAATEIYPE